MEKDADKQIHSNTGKIYFTGMNRSISFSVIINYVKNRVTDSKYLIGISILSDHVQIQSG